MYNTLNTPRALETATGLSQAQIRRMPNYILDAMISLNRELNTVKKQLATVEGVKPVKDRFGSYRVEGIHVFHDYNQYIYPLTAGAGRATLVDQYGAAVNISTHEAPLGRSGFRIDWDSKGMKPAFAVLPVASNCIDVVERSY